GFLAFRWLLGRPASLCSERQRAPSVLARYLACRTELTSSSDVEPEALSAMVRLNVQEAAGLELPGDFELPSPRPVHADARLMPHEWIVFDNCMLKTDAVDHGDDHFFPGPTDIAFDLAGAAVEWNFDDARCAAMLEEYGRLTGDDARPRLPRYVVAYCASRIGICTFAESSTEGHERLRWRRMRAVYRVGLRRALEKLGVRSDSTSWPARREGAALTRRASPLRPRSPS
ncbi:MAG TPA: hypothetical protein VIM73_18405, partial [Polyangiaceae bacterium]